MSALHEIGLVYRSFFSHAPITMIVLVISKACTVWVQSIGPTPYHTEAAQYRSSLHRYFYTPTIMTSITLTLHNLDSACIPPPPHHTEQSRPSLHRSFYTLL